jgi:excisionase family DNA binding protein
METVFLSLSKNDFQDLLAETVNSCLKYNSKPNTPTEPADRWFNVDELINYLPDRPTRQNIYRKVSNNEIPHYKDAKKLRFLKSEIDQWLKQGRKKTSVELQADIETATNATT